MANIALNHVGALVPDLLLRPLRRFPHRVAVDLDGRTLTFSQVSERASRLHAAFTAHGIGPGQRVALLALNELEFLEIRVGAQRAGVILVPLNYRLSESELHAMVADCEPDLMLVSPEFADMAGRMPVPEVWVLGGGDSYEAATQAVDPAPDPVGFDPESICHISYTSGTTGQPKGVMLSNRAIHAGTVAMGEELGASSDSVFLAATPLFHIGSQVPLSCTRLGGTLVVSKRFDAREFIEALDRTGANSTQLVPAMVQMVLDAWDPARGQSSLRRILYGAAPMPPSLLREAIAIWGCKFINGYGSTESTGISFLSPDEHDPEGAPELLASVGRSSTLTVSRVVDDGDEDVAPGEIGEVLARSAATMSGYWRNNEATVEALRGGFMHTGDLAYRDEHGYLYLVDRRHDKIVTGGENVFPSEVEHVLLTHPAIADVGVVGVPDRVWGETVTAVIVVHDETQLTAAEAIAYCRESLAGYKVPKTVHFRTGTLPRTATGKLLRRDLRKDLA